MTPEELLAEYGPEVVEVAEALRLLFRETIPDATERAYPGWRGIGYRHPKAGLLGTIFPLADRVSLYFEHGRSLPDPQGVLMGEGTQTRQVSFRTADEVPVQALRNIILEAVAYGDSRRAPSRAKTRPRS